MRKILFVFLVSSLLFAFNFLGKVDIPTVKTSPEIHQGDLILSGNNVTVIEGMFDINGSIVVEENATLILRNALVNFTQTQNGEHSMTFRNPLNGNPRLLVENATITASDYYLTVSLENNSTSTVLELDASNFIQFGLHGISNASISDSTVYSLYNDDSATVNLSNTRIVVNLWGYSSSTMRASNCTIGSLRAEQFCTASVSDSAIGTFTSEAYSVNCSITMLKPGFFNSWNYRDNCSISISLEGSAPDVALSECQIERWSFEFQGSSNTSISNSLLYHLFLRHLSVAAASDSIFTSIYTHDSSVNWLANSTSTNYFHYAESFTNVYWYLGVHVVDSISQDLAFSNVTATYPNTTVAESKLTDAGGWARLTLMEKMMNATGEYHVGNYTVEATYETYLNHTTVNMTGNQQIKLELQLVIDTVSPVISVLSPENETFYLENNVSLTFTVDEPTDWIGYSLNGEVNMTILGNTTLTDLSDGAYDIFVYANDTAGNMGASAVTVFWVDTTPPAMGYVSQTPPEDNVLPEDEVMVTAGVTDNLGGWPEATLNYTTNNGTWFTTPMTWTGGINWTATIPRFPYGTNVTYIVIAEDDAGNTVTSEELGYDTQYQVIPEFPSFPVLLLFIVATLLAVIACRRKHLT